MRQFRHLRFALFLAVAGEILSLVWLGKALGLLGAVAVLVAAAVLGVVLIRRSGVGLRKLVKAGASTSNEISSQAAGSLLAGMAGLFLLMPGLVSDAAALLLLLPFTRTRLAKVLRFGAFVVRPQPGGTPPGQVIEAEAVEIIEPDHRLR